MARGVSGGRENRASKKNEGMIKERVIGLVYSAPNHFHQISAHDQTYPLRLISPQSPLMLP